MNVLDSTPYAWPYDGDIAPERTALVVCGALGEWAAQTPEDPSIEVNVDHLRTAAAECGVFVVLLDQTTDASLGGVPLRRSVDLTPLPGETAVVAAGIDGFYGSPLDTVLQRHGCTHLLFVGRGFETTVHSTLRRANDRGYECLTIADACAALDPRLQAASISTIEMSGGIFGAVGSTASVLHTLHNHANETNEEATWQS